MDPKLACKGKLSKLVPHHLFCDVHRDEILPIMDCESKPNELRWNIGITCPRLDDLLIAGLNALHNFFEESLINVRAFFGRARQGELGEKK